MLLEHLSYLLSAAALSGAAAAESDLGAAVQNLISSLISAPLKFTFDNGAPNGDANFLNIQPVNLRTEAYYNVVRPVGRTGVDHRVHATVPVPEILTPRVRRGVFRSRAAARQGDCRPQWCHAALRRRQTRSEGRGPYSQDCKFVRFGTVPLRFTRHDPPDRSCAKARSSAKAEEEIMNRFARPLLLTTALVTALAAAVRTLSKGMTIMTIKTLIDQQHSDR